MRKRRQFCWLLAVGVLSGCVPIQREQTADNSAITDAKQRAIISKDGSGVPVYKSFVGDAVSVDDRGTDFLLKANWYRVENAEGTVEGIYGIGSGSQASEQVVKAIMAETDKKVIPTEFEDIGWRAGWFGADRKEAVKQIKAALNEMVNSAVDQVCGFRARPTTFTMDAEVKVSLGIGGSVRLGMVWEAKDLCE